MAASKAILEMLYIFDKGGDRAAKLIERLDENSPNMPIKVMDAGVMWEPVEEYAGWKVQKNSVTQHIRILNPEGVRIAWGNIFDITGIAERFAHGNQLLPKAGSAAAGNLMTEQDVLNHFGVQKFSEMSNDNIMQFISMRDQMDPEVAKAALEQMPEFSSTVREMFDGYKSIIERGLESNDASIQNVYDAYHEVMESLSALLAKDDLSFEEKKYVIEQMTEIADKMDLKDSENRKMVQDVITVAGVVGVLAVAIIGGIFIGTAVKKKLDDSDDVDDDIGEIDVETPFVPIESSVDFTDAEFENLRDLNLRELEL